MMNLLTECASRRQVHDSSRAAPPSNLNGRNDISIDQSESASDMDTASGGGDDSDTASSAQISTTPSRYATPAGRTEGGAIARSKKKINRRERLRRKRERSEARERAAAEAQCGAPEVSTQGQGRGDGAKSLETGVSMGGVFSVFDYFILRARFSPSSLCPTNASSAAWASARATAVLLSYSCRPAATGERRQHPRRVCTPATHQRSKCDGARRFLVNGAGTDYQFARRIHCAMRLPVLGGMTQSEGVALGAFSTSGPQADGKAPGTNLGAHGLLLENGAPLAPIASFRCALSPSYWWQVLAVPGPFLGADSLLPKEWCSWAKNAVKVLANQCYAAQTLEAYPRC